MLTDRSDLSYASTKTYTHSVGLSCAFRQWRADSHCKFIHGYPFEITFTFSSDTLDVRNWVVDFGSLKSLKGQLEDMFDHKLLVAEDDPYREFLLGLHKLEIADVRVVPATGCEACARYVFEIAETWLTDNGYGNRVNLESVEVRKHQANSAIVRRKGNHG